MTDKKYDPSLVRPVATYQPQSEKKFDPDDYTPAKTLDEVMEERAQRAALLDFDALVLAGEVKSRGSYDALSKLKLKPNPTQAAIVKWLRQLHNVEGETYRCEGTPGCSPCESQDRMTAAFSLCEACPRRLLPNQPTKVGFSGDRRRNEIATINKIANRIERGEYGSTADKQVAPIRVDIVCAHPPLPHHAADRPADLSFVFAVLMHSEAAIEGAGFAFTRRDDRGWCPVVRLPDGWSRESVALLGHVQSYVVDCDGVPRIHLTGHGLPHAYILSSDESRTIVGSIGSRASKRARIAVGLPPFEQECYSND